MRLEELATITENTGSDTPSQDDDERKPMAETILTNELVRPSEAGWVSYNDDPWTTYGDMAKKHNADVAKELYEFTTSAGTGWWGETSPAGFGPQALLPYETARFDWTQFDGLQGETVQADDPALVRRAAGFKWDDSSPYRVKIRGQYSDYLAAAGVFPVATDEDDEPTYGDDDVWVDGVWNDDEWETILRSEGLEAIA